MVKNGLDITQKIDIQLTYALDHVDSVLIMIYFLFFSDIPPLISLFNIGVWKKSLMDVYL